ncbi:hypothetical protein C882_3479 [Caenispirillum salinarum AK4]|uniref:Uncharacterized protein n=1 Tax=Caenispirillum salinarum AK4 TaxID=1238182 RepID=K9H3W3_9PROT|nr:hypothetical protein [Caenispirillum salinarum]EKV31729.1 hypothetical protein C882_3479 [Caenispirillum salinarum AK4]
MTHLFYAISLMTRDVGRLFLGVGMSPELARLAAKERRELGLPY